MVYDILSRDGRIKAKDWPGLLDRAALERAAAIARATGPVEEGPTTAPADRGGIDESGHRHRRRIF